MAAAKREKAKSTNATRGLIKKCASEYKNALHIQEGIAKDIKAAKAQVGYAKIKQKYLQALERAFLTVTELFSKKHGHSLKAGKGAKKRKPVRKTVKTTVSRKKKKALSTIS